MSATDDEARRAYLLSIRDRLGFSQTIMGGCLGMSLRAYSDLETGASRVRTIHILAAERVLLRQAAGRPNPELLTKPLRDDVKALTAAALD
ncbi:UNVERIFIED_ORG: transcriptional regulator with XRE-family HTH domain [Methylorubrum zatmanii]